MKRLSNKECYDKLVKSDCYIETVNQQDKNKVIKARQGTNPTTPSSYIGQVAVELGLRAHADENPSNGGTDPTPPVNSSWGLYAKPTVMCHAHDGGVEYQENMAAAGFTAMLDLNDPGGKPAWDTFRARAKTAGLPCTYWRHCHTYVEIQNALTTFKADGTGGLNLEDMVTEGLNPKDVAEMIDDILGPDSIVAIPTMGSIQQIDWSPLNRHVFLLEFFPNDPPPDWVGKDLEYLIRFCADTARAWGVKKLNFVCGVYYTDTNPHSKLYTSNQYLTALKNQGEIFGGIYLGDNNGPNYEQWS